MSNSFLLLDTKDEEEGRVLSEKCHEYLDRAESLQEFLKTGKKVDDGQKRRKLCDGAVESKSVTAMLNPKLLEQVKASILVGKTGVSMDDVIGLDGIKKELNESITIPMMFPLTMADRGMSNAVLLYGVS